MGTGIPPDAPAGAGLSPDPGFSPETGVCSGTGEPPAGGLLAGRQRPRPPGGWTAGRIAAVVAGAVLALVSLGSLGGGGTLLWADQSLRQDGYLTTGTSTYSTGGYALASDRIELGWGWLVTGLLGNIRVRVAAADPARPVFVAIGPADRVSAYLAGTSYATVTGTGPGGLTSHHGTAAPALPGTVRIWTAHVSGTGTQTLRWTARTGDWMVVAMNSDGSAGLTVRADAGASASWLFQLAVDLIVGGIALGAASAALIIVPVRLASRTR